MNLIFPFSPDEFSPNDNDAVFCLDFEFDDFKNTNPISIGICSLNQKHQFYREFDFPDNYAQANDWVKENVIKHLQNNQKPLNEVFEDLNRFLSDFSGKNIYLISDHDVDVSIMEKLKPQFSFSVTVMTIELYVYSYATQIHKHLDLNKDENYAKFEVTNSNILNSLEEYEDYFKTHNIIQHHALNDTVVMATLLERGINEKDNNRDI